MEEFISEQKPAFFASARKRAWKSWMSPVKKGKANFIKVAKAMNITHINCPDLKVGAIENQAHTGL